MFNPFVRASERVHPYAGHALVAVVSVAMLGFGLWIISEAMRYGTLLLGAFGAVVVAHAIYWLVHVANLIYWTPRPGGRRG